MGIKIVKNTIPEGVRLFLDRQIERYKVSLERANEVLRSDIVAPLDFPVDTGRLKGSIGEVLEINTSARGGESKMGTKVEYAPYVEFGTTRQRPRRYMQKGINTATPKLKSIFKKALEI